MVNFYSAYLNDDAELASLEDAVGKKERRIDYD